MRYPVDYHALAVELVTFACAGNKGRGENDVVYQAVTEGRDSGSMQKTYSSCGDLAHWLFYRLGVRLPWVNRAENGGHRASWTENNITLLQRFKPRMLHPRSEVRYQPGDVNIIWNTGYDAHVFVTLDDRQPNEVLVAEYGQPGGVAHARPVSYRGNTMMLGSYRNGVAVVGTRPLQCVLRLDDVIDVADKENMLAGPESAEMWAKRVGLPVPSYPPVPEDPPPLIR